MNTLQGAWQHPGSGRSLTLRQAATPWSRWARAALRGPAWLALIAGLCVLGLLLTFQQVVLQGVEQGEARNRAVAAHAEGVWRCNSLRSAGERAGCRVQLDAMHAGSAMANPRGEAAAVAVVSLEP